MKKIFCEIDSFIARSIKWCDVLGAHSESIFPFMQYFISFQKTLIRVIDCWRDDDEFSWNNFYFIVVKEFFYGKNTAGFLEKNWLFSEYYCECQLLWWFEIGILLSRLALYKKLKLMGRAMKYFLKKLPGHEIFRSLVSWATNFFLKICKTLRTPLLHT